MSEVEEKYYLVKATVLPETFIKVMRVKELLHAGKIRSVNEAVKQVDLSRSAYYKYRDAILPFYESGTGRILSLLFLTEDFPGVLSGILDCLAHSKANILTINQNYPINGLADISVVIDTRNLNCELDALMHELGRISGVCEHRLLARER